MCLCSCKLSRLPKADGMLSSPFCCFGRNKCLYLPRAVLSFTRAEQETWLEMVGLQTRISRQASQGCAAYSQLRILPVPFLSCTRSLRSVFTVPSSTVWCVCSLSPVSSPPTTLVKPCRCVVFLGTLGEGVCCRMRFPTVPL